MKIGALGSRIQDPHAEEASHMMIAAALSDDGRSMFATHPPLRDRIKAINPHWDGKYPKVKLPSIGAGAARDADVSKAKIEKEKKQDLRFPGGEFIGAAVALSAAETMNNIGHLHAEHLQRAQMIFRRFPPHWHEAAKDTSGAQAVIFALLLAQDDELRGSELTELQRDVDSGSYEEITKLHAEFGDLHSSEKIALIDLTIPSLRRLSPEEYQRFLEITDKLMQSDQRIDLFEFTLQKIIKRHLNIYFHRTEPAKIRYRHLSELPDETSVLLSTLARLSGDDARDHDHAFSAGAKELKLDLGTEPSRYEGEVDLHKIDEALNRFDAATPLVKKRLLYACSRTVMADDEITSDEAELLRAIADTIGVPVPPFVKVAAAAS